MADKKFLESHRMKAGVIANLEAFSMVVVLLVASVKSPIVTSDSLELAMFAFMGAIGVWGIGAGTNGIQRIKEAARPEVSGTSTPLASTDKLSQ